LLYEQKFPAYGKRTDYGTITNEVSKTTPRLFGGGAKSHEGQGKEEWRKL
jgi:hypothetical protein